VLRRQVWKRESYPYQDADYLVNYLSLLMQQHISADDLSRQLFAYPTQASDLYGIWQSK